MINVSTPICKSFGKPLNIYVRYWRYPCVRTNRYPQTTIENKMALNYHWILWTICTTVSVITCFIHGFPHHFGHWCSQHVRSRAANPWYSTLLSVLHNFLSRTFKGWYLPWKRVNRDTIGNDWLWSHNQDFYKTCPTSKVDMSVVWGTRCLWIIVTCDNWIKKGEWFKRHGSKFILNSQCLRYV